jgi:hypothetical protein
MLTLTTQEGCKLFALQSRLSPQFAAFIIIHLPRPE